MNSFAHYPSLKNKVVYITGGASGIGASLVIAFAQQGSKVAFVDIQDDAASSLCESLESSAAHLPYYQNVDVVDIAALKKSIHNAMKKFGPINILINNVAHDKRHSALDVTPEEWRSGLSVNLDAAFFATQTVIPEMQKMGGGVILNLSSINPILGLTNMSAYVSAKAALVGLSKSLAREFGRDNIRVNAVSPGWIATERQLATWYTPEEEARWDKLTALSGRILPEDVANLTLFLSADDSRKITGQQFIIDAGRT